ncbi:uncharacterized protein [Manis javanica]|uniref:uncharacterized protein isoform X3 n=1 Tax=Manis javanica TaxID=9974 RepID=UPI003C6DB762
MPGRTQLTGDLQMFPFPVQSQLGALLPAASHEQALTGQRIQWSSTGENDRHKEKGKTPMPPGFQLLRRSLWLPSQVSGIPEFPQRIMVDLPRFLHAWKMV